MAGERYHPFDRPLPTNNPDFNQFHSDLLTYHRVAARGKRDTMNNMEFETNCLFNLASLAGTVHYRSYVPSPSIAFIIREPVTREIFAAPFRDRVIHHYIYAKTIDWWTDHFVPTSYSCLQGRGTLYAIETTYEQMREISNNFTEEVYYLKMDLQGYFMSLNRKKLLASALRGLREQYKGNYGYEYDTLRFLWEQTIMDDPTRTCTPRNYPRDWEGLPRSKSLFHQPPGVGIVIGNLTSQELSNIYLNDFDWFVSDTLGWQHYGRYVDDFVFFAKESDLPRALDDLKRIENFLVGKDLVLHPRKRQIQPIRHGLPFLGVTIFPDRIVPGKRVTKNALRAARQYSIGARGGESIISYLGMIQHYDSERLSDRILDIIFPEDDRFDDPVFFH